MTFWDITVKVGHRPTAVKVIADLPPGQNGKRLVTGPATVSLDLLRHNGKVWSQAQLQ